MPKLENIIKYNKGDCINVYPNAAPRNGPVHGDAMSTEKKPDIKEFNEAFLLSQFISFGLMVIILSIIRKKMINKTNIMETKTGD